MMITQFTLSCNSKMEKKLLQYYDIGDKILNMLIKISKFISILYRFKIINIYLHVFNKQ